MITAHRLHLLRRCQQRGYTLSEVMGCVVQAHGDIWVIDETHPAYPHAAKTGTQEAGAAKSGPGTELKKLLATVGIKASPNCSCNAKAAQMDAWGPDECESRREEIVSWLGEEAVRRKLPFSRLVARQVVRLAISRARKSSRRAGPKDING